MSTEQYYCTLTDDDRAAIERDRHDAEAKIGMLAMRKQRINDRIKTRTQAAESDAKAATAILRAGRDYRDVRAVIDESRGVVQLYRVDTGEFVATRPLTPEERQPRLL